MKKIYSLAMLLMIFVGMTSCSKDDDPQDEQNDLIGTWLLVKFEGWELDSDYPGGQFNFSENYSYDSNGTPTDYLEGGMQQKWVFTETYGNLRLKLYYWDGRNWINDEDTPVTYDGKHLIVDGDPVDVKKLDKNQLIIQGSDEDYNATMTFKKL